MIGFFLLYEIKEIIAKCQEKSEQCVVLKKGGRNSWSVFQKAEQKRDCKKG
jgi:hypothetical protein